MSSSGAPRLMGGTFPVACAPRVVQARAPAFTGERLARAARRRRDRRPGTAARRRRGSIVSTPSASHSSACAAHLRRPCPRAGRAAIPSSSTTVEHALRSRRAQPLEAALEIGLVLAAERVEAERPPDGRGIAPDALARARRARRAVRGTRRASTPSTCSSRRQCSATSREQPIALAARRTRAGAAVAPRPAGSPRRARVIAAVVVERSAAEQSGDDVDRLTQPIEALTRRRHLHADRVVLGFVPTRTRARRRGGRR